MSDFKGRYLVGVDVGGTLEGDDQGRQGGRRVAIGSYSEIVRWLANDDPAARRIIEDILKTEKEHGDDLEPAGDAEEIVVNDRVDSRRLTFQ